MPEGGTGNAWKGVSDVIEIEIRCPVETKVLCVLRVFVCSVAREMGFDDTQVDQIEMAVDEACTNVVRHAYKHLGVSADLPTEFDAPRTDCLLVVRAAITPESLRISIIDKGIGVDKMPPGVESVEEFQEKGGGGGLGIYIIRNFMDEVEYHVPPGAGTVLTMTKYLQPSQNTTS